MSKLSEDLEKHLSTEENWRSLTDEELVERVRELESDARYWQETHKNDAGALAVKVKRQAARIAELEADLRRAPEVVLSACAAAASAARRAALEEALACCSSAWNDAPAHLKAPVEIVCAIRDLLDADKK